MSLSRIYQGRISELQVLSSDAKAPPETSYLTNELEDQSISPLWHHHQTFQDAINYYLLALGALARDPQPQDSRLISDLRSRLQASWEDFPRSITGPARPRSLRDSVSNWIGEPETLDAAFDTILNNQTATPDARKLALALLLERCGGEAAIQQGGRGYFPRFCDPKAEPTYDFSTASLAAASGKDRLAALLHGEPDSETLREVAGEMDLAWTVKVQPGKTFTDPESRARLNEAVDHWLTQVAEPTGRLADTLTPFPNSANLLEEIRAGIANLPEPLAVPRNRKASKDLTFASLLFQHFPTAFTATLLRLFIKEPTKQDTEPQKGPDFAALGDDPIKLARGTRGFVFPAFTALPAWNPPSPGTPVWKEFDIAAFKEALKSLNQFNQKTAERADAETDLRGKLAILLGSSVKGWKPKKSDGEEVEAAPEALDSDLFQRARELESRLTEDLADTVLGEPQEYRFGDASFVQRPGSWQISTASLRGFRDIAQDWNRLLDAEPNATQKALEDVVKDYQRQEKNKKLAGSLPLLLLLCESPFHPLWRNHESDADDQIGSNRFLYQVTDFHRTFRDWERSKQAINLTPAEPTHSRRLYMFSDIGDKLAKVSFLEDGQTAIECAIAMKEGEQWREKRARLIYSAPRLKRDNIASGSARWLQPMMAALDLDTKELGQVEKRAVSLMPDARDISQLRFLLNFPVTLDPAPLHEALGMSTLWHGQFNGVKGKNLHLHWPTTIKGKAGAKSPWWKNEKLRREGFTVHSVDLGQRTAGAWSLLRITAWDPREKGATKHPVRSIGRDDTSVEWFAEVLRSGTHRLPGEDQKVHDKDRGKLVHERSGKEGRNASKEEYDAGLLLASLLGSETPTSWIGETPNSKSHPQQNDSLLAIAMRRLSRLNTFHSWSCRKKALEKLASEPRRQASNVHRLLEELAHWNDEQVKSWREDILKAHPMLSQAFLREGKSHPPSVWSDRDIAEWEVQFKPSHFETFSMEAGARFTAYRSELKESLEKLANRTTPLRKKTWKWKAPENGRPGMLTTEGKAPECVPKIRGQRGLSIDRLEQIEKLRVLFLRYNRSFDKTPGEPAPIGFGIGHDSGEPCPDLLDKLDRLKEQRVNQTAHLILAQALGVRLKQEKAAASDRTANDIHGEYERIPGREPVDFVVIENLDRYLTSQGRAPSENRRLMKWSHRAIRDKLKMLTEEPFGIPVVEAPAAYSSRFCSKTGQAGSRAEERHSLDTWLQEQLEKRAASAPKKNERDLRPLYSDLLTQFTELGALNKRQLDAKKKRHTLILTKSGGPLFVPAKEGHIVQADINAAANIGLRAVASPDSLHLIHKVRTMRKQDSHFPVMKNAREKSAYKTKPTISPVGTLWEKTASAAAPNFFHDDHMLTDFDRATVEVTDATDEIRPVQLASGIALWSTINYAILQRIVAINQTRLDTWKNRAKKCQ